MQSLQATQMKRAGVLAAAPTPARLLPLLPPLSSSSHCSRGTPHSLPARPQVQVASMGGMPRGMPRGVGIELDHSGGMGGGMGGGGLPLIGQEPTAQDAVWDPENQFKGIPLKAGIIERRMMQRQIEVDKDFAKAMKGAQDEQQKEAIFRREMRKCPTEPDAVIEFFLDTPADDLEWMVVRHRPNLSVEFFKQLDTIIGQERFNPLGPDEERVNELDMLRKYLAEATESLDKFIESSVSAVGRVKKLLGAKDKKEMILEMAAANEIDYALMSLLQQNIDAAREAEQDSAVEFMEKVKQAAAKYCIKPAGMELPASANTPKAPPGSPLELPNVQKAASGSVLELPGTPKAASGATLELPKK